jgi:hypothetical protein
VERDGQASVNEKTISSFGKKGTVRSDRQEQLKGGNKMAGKIFTRPIFSLPYFFFVAFFVSVFLVPHFLPQAINHHPLANIAGFNSDRIAHQVLPRCEQNQLYAESHHEEKQRQ